MKKRRIISAIMAFSLTLSQLPCFAQTDTNEEVYQEQSVEATSEVKKEVIASEDFSKGLSSWTVEKGNGFYVINNKLVFDNLLEKSTPSVISSNDMSIDNGEIEFEFNINKGKHFGLTFRMQNDKTLYTVRFSPQHKRISLLKKINGGVYRTIKEVKATIEYDKYYKGGITLIGGNIEVKLDDQKIMSVRDTSLKNGKIGFEGLDSIAFVRHLETFKYDNIEYDIVEVDNTVKEKKFVYVSADADETIADGTEEKPYKSIYAAKDAVKKMSKRNTPVDVVFSEGIYPITETISFTTEDSGTEKAPIRYIAKKGDNVVFTGSKKIDVTKFEPVGKDIKERLYERVQDKVLQIDLAEQGIPSHLINFTALGESSAIGKKLKPLIFTLNGAQQTIARWPNADYNTIVDCETGDNVRWGGNKDSAGTIYYTESNPSRWQKADNLYIQGFLANYWCEEWAKVDNVDIDKGAINMRYYTAYGIEKDHRWAAINLLEEIDIPGEWFIDSKTNMMYYYPPHELTAKDSFEVAVLDKNMMDFAGAENVIIEDIELTMTADDPTVPESNDIGGHGINISKNSKNITIKNCVLSHIGMSGININANDITVDGCLIYNVGYNGINIGKVGDRNTLTDSNVVIKNCDISDVSRDASSNHSAGVAIQMDAVGVTVTNNVIHNCENSAIRYAGNSHKISYNEIYDVVTKSADAGAIYAGRSWAEYGTVVNYNLFHDIGQKNNSSQYPASSIFWDDYQSGSEFSNNISVVNNYAKTSTVKIGGGVHNIVKGNTMVASQRDIIGEDRNSAQKEEWSKYAGSTLRLNSVPYTSAEWLSKYPQISSLLPNIEKNNGILKLENTITDNLSVDCTETRIASTIIDASVYENNVFLPKDYSVFVNPEKLDYRVTKAAKEKYNISDEVLDEDFDLEKIGIVNGYKLDKTKLNFRATYPENNSTIEKKDAIIAWTKAPLADNYHYIVATDPDFKNVILDDITIYQSVKIENLQLATTYYWKVYARHNARQNTQESEAVTGVMKFTTALSETLDTTQLEHTIEMAYDTMSGIVEGNEVGQYKAGTIKLINEKLREAEGLAALSVGVQTEIDIANYEFKNFINNIGSMVNNGYTTFNFKNSSQWYANKSETTVKPMNGSVRVEFGAGTEVSLLETLSNYNIMCFKTKVDVLENTWVAYGLRALDKETEIYHQDSYYVIAKKDIFEFQKYGVICATVPNNGIMKEGEWYDIQFGAINTDNGVNVVFKVNDQVVFDYLDKNDPQNKPGMFAIFAAKGNVVEIADADVVPEGLFEFSDKIMKEISIREEDGKTLMASGSEYSETGAWNDNTSLKGENDSKVRTAVNSNSSAKWIMESGSKGNGKLYKVSYYHIPSADGDKNVTIKISSYAGEYETTIDLSQGEEGYVEIGTFTFIAADYIGRLSAEFIGSGTGSVNVSNIKYELVDESQYSNMLK